MYILTLLLFKRRKGLRLITGSVIYMYIDKKRGNLYIIFLQIVNPNIVICVPILIFISLCSATRHSVQATLEFCRSAMRFNTIQCFTVWTFEATALPFPASSSCRVRCYAINRFSIWTALTTSAAMQVRRNQLSPSLIHMSAS